MGGLENISVDVKKQEVYFSLFGNRYVVPLKSDTSIKKVMRVLEYSSGLDLRYIRTILLDKFSLNVHNKIGK